MYDPPNENNTLPPPENRSFDVLCHHVIYGKKEWDKILPLGYALVGTVREPWNLFKATLNYMKPFYFNRIKEENFIHAFLEDPRKYEPKNFRMSLTNNRMSFEFGVNHDIIFNRDYSAFKQYLEKLDREFDVVIVAERYDESLVLMKRYLEWSMEDIIYASKNVLSKHYRFTFQTTLDDQEKFANYSVFDHILYDFFKKRLDKQIIAEGPSFADEVKQFQAVRAFVENFCRKVPHSVKTVVIEESDWNPTLEISREDCTLLIQSELVFTQAIRLRQYGSATWTKKP